VRATFPLPGAKSAVITAGKIAAANDHQLFEEEAGKLVLRYDAGSATIGGLAGSGARVWFLLGTELGTLEGGKIALSKGAALPAGAVLSASPTGDVWVASAGTLTRFSVGGPVSPEEADWQKTIVPVFARTCGKCHAPGGTAQIDLSSYQAWSTRRDLIFKRVAVDRTMPPMGTVFSTGNSVPTPMSEEERAIVKKWSSP
jgi:hypothetical protein